MAELKLYKDEYYLWFYVPSKAASMTFLILFLVSTLFIIYRMIRTRTFFSIPFILGGLREYKEQKLHRFGVPFFVLETIGYCARALAEEHTDLLLPYIIQYIFILVAPALFAASIYMTLGRLIRSVKGEKLSIISVRWLTKLFVLGDVMSFVVQVFGGGMAANEDADPVLAENIIIAGLVVQIIIFGLFAVTALIFHIRMRRCPEGVSPELNPGWKKNLGMMYTVSVLIMVRSVFRLIEYIMGGDSYLLRNEWPLYVFDSALMFLTMAYYSWYYPGNLRVNKGGSGEWATVGSRPGTASGMELKNQQPSPSGHPHQYAQHDEYGQQYAHLQPNPHHQQYQQRQHQYQQQQQHQHQHQQPMYHAQ
ncbi:RTA-like protein [Paramyrothecium foliicola]|nr:RTA-like protein [Paramyrothecium foliicola]